MNLNISKLPDVSIIIITMGRHKLAERAVRSILETDYPDEKRQIIIVEETNISRPIDGKNVLYHPIPEKRLGFGYARNKGLGLATNHIVVFVDDDCQVEHQWLQELVLPLMKQKAGAIGGAVLVPDCGPVGECENILGFPGGGIKYVNDSQGEIIARETFSTCNCAVLRSEIQKVSGFNENLRYGSEDENLSRRIASRRLILYNPRAIVRHIPRDSLVKVFLWFIRRGRSRYMMIRESRNYKFIFFEVLKNSPFLRLAFAITALAILGIAVSFAISTVIVFYYTIILFRFRWSRKFFPARKTYLLLPIVKTLMDFGMDIGIASGIFLRVKS